MSEEETHDSDSSNVLYRAGYLRGMSLQAEGHDREVLERASKSLVEYAKNLKDPDPRQPLKVEVRDLYLDGTRWRLYVGPYGIADWPSSAAEEDPQSYAEEVARLLRTHLRDPKLDVLEAAARICREHADVLEDPNAKQAAEECSYQILEFRNQFKVSV